MLFQIALHTCLVLVLLAPPLAFLTTPSWSPVSPSWYFPPIQVGSRYCDSFPLIYTICISAYLCVRHSSSNRYVSSVHVASPCGSTCLRNHDNELCPDSFSHPSLQCAISGNVGLSTRPNIPSGTPASPVKQQHGHCAQLSPGLPAASSSSFALL